MRASVHLAILLPALLVALSSAHAQEHGEFQLTLELHYRSAEETIGLYQGLSGNPATIASLRGSRLALETTALLAGRHLDLSQLTSALEAAKFNQDLGDDVFQMREARRQVGAIQELFAELRRRNFGEKVASTVEQLFPAGATVRGTLPMYFVAFGHPNIDAFVRRVLWQGDTPIFVGEGEGEPTIVINLAKAVRYGTTVDERFVRLLSTVAHEVFHAAFDAYKDQSSFWRAYYAGRRSPLDLLLDLTQNEGIAYYLSLIQIAHGRLPLDWRERVAGAFATFNRSADELCTAGISRRRVEEILRSSNTAGYWESFGAITGMVMAKAIDQELGREALSETLARGPADFFTRYLEAARREGDLPALGASVRQALTRSAGQ
jgi:hypothetical protein